LKKIKIFNIIIFSKKLPKWQKLAPKKMLGGVNIYSIYIRKLSQRGEYNKFKIPAFGNLGRKKTLAWIA
jgi:hypothetical protein